MSQLHRENPEATPEEMEILQIAAAIGIGQFAPEPPDGPDEIPEGRLVRECEQCGGDFYISEEFAARSRTKWGRRCSYCLADEF